MLEDILEPGQLELLDLLARAAARVSIFKAPLVEPSQEFFPEAYEPTLVGAGRILHRLLAFAGWGDRELKLEDVRAPFDDKSQEQLEVTQPTVDFIAVEGKRVVFQVERLGPGDVTAAALCHEVARAVVADEDPGVVAAAVVALGFGLLLLPAAVSYRRSSVFTGHFTVTRQALVMTGALPPGDLALLLGAWLVVRGSNEVELLPKYLATEQAENIEKWVKALAPARLKLLERLKLPYSDERVVRRMPQVAPLDLKPLEQAEAAHRQPHQGSVAKRVWQRKTVDYGIIGALLGLLGMLPMGLGAPLSLIWLPVAVGLFGGVVLGRRSRRWYCTACGMLLHAHENLCPKCGARIEGEAEAVTTVEQMADADDDDELTKAALAAAPPPEED